MDGNLSRRLRACVACSVLAVGGLVLAPGGPATAAGCGSEEYVVRGDLDGDGQTDVAVGMPWHSDQAGAVDLRYTGAPSRVLVAGDLGGGGGEGSSFGAAVAVADLDQDRCADLVISEPDNGRGRVHVVLRAPGGVDPATAITLSPPEDVDGFGAALAVQARVTGTTVVHDLYVGAPRTTVDSLPAAGAVVQYAIAPDPARRIVVGAAEVRHQNSRHSPGKAEANDEFGSVLAAGPMGVVVGAPLEDVGTVVDAGAVWYLRTDENGLPMASQSWSQAGVGVAGSPEMGDHFGASLAARGRVVAVGVPEEDGGTKADSGMVQLFIEEEGRALVADISITQNTAGIPGTVEAGDRFGASVAVGVALLCQESVDVAVGAPGEDIGSVQDAGSVTLTRSGRSGCPAVALSQGSGLAGAKEQGDRVGQVLGVTRGRTDLDEDEADRLLIGVPSEDIGAVADSGMVQPAKGGIVVDGVLRATLTYSKGSLNSRSYGMVLSSTSD